MDNESIKKKILADYTTLLGLKHDNADLVKEKLIRVEEHIGQLDRALSEMDIVSEASRLVDAALTSEFVAFTQAMTEENKEEALAQVKHKVGEACQLLQIRA